ncbi:unnamed protein product [Sphenostylis stenocarpa]|uniref:Nodulin-like domain-containing protein n=1 Tax=Sphenostylis stenocarpa TaxID=92480 RepID=A0AA86SLC9_9FABA|nr:unnamed protein product [Sphenostylis stenocarpa]
MVLDSYAITLISNVLFTLIPNNVTLIPNTLLVSDAYVVTLVSDVYAITLIPNSVVSDAYAVTLIPNSGIRCLCNYSDFLTVYLDFLTVVLDVYAVTLILNSDAYAVTLIPNSVISPNVYAITLILNNVTLIPNNMPYVVTLIPKSMLYAVTLIPDSDIRGDNWFLIRACLAKFLSYSCMYRKSPIKAPNNGIRSDGCEGVRGAQMSGVCLRDVGHGIRRHLLHVWEHIVGDKEQHGFQPEAAWVSPIWALFLVGIFQNVLGYGLVWLLITHRIRSLPFWQFESDLSDAHALFDEIPQPNAVTLNTMISGYVHAGQFRNALSFFMRLERSHVCGDAFSFTIVVANCLIDLYGKCGPVEYAVRVFSETVENDVISWNSIIAASANNGYIELAYKFLNLVPNPDTVSYNGLINGIAQVGNMEDVVHVLSSLPNPNSSSWNSVISGFVNKNRTREALDMFCKMHLKNVEMDEFTFLTILDGIASLAALTWGMLIHCCTIKCGLDDSVVIGSALIDMYSKSRLLMFS